jgi:threonine synthase
MHYVSTRGGAAPAGLSAGIAADGGLYVPERMPRIGKPPLGGYLAGTALHSAVTFCCPSA